MTMSSWSMSTFRSHPPCLAGQVDAVIGAFRNFELNQMAIEKRPGRAFLVEEYGVPAYDELILVAKKTDCRRSQVTKIR